MVKDQQLLSIQQRRRRNREEIIEDIVQIARRMIQTDGAASLSFNAIARQLGIQPPSLYTYFESKHAIYDELFRRGWTLFLQQTQVEELDLRDEPIREKLIRFFTLYMRFAQENVDYYQIMFQRPVPDFVPSDESLAISFTALAHFTEYLQGILESEGIDPGIPYEQARDIIIALNHGLTEQHLANNPELPVGGGRYGGLIHQAVDVLLKAWSAKSTSVKA
jgi:AcrR family transcriptional regulator